MRTRSTTVAEAIANRKWWVVELADKNLGRAAARIAYILRGKHKPSHTPHIDDGDFVIVINADKVRLTGKKMENKMYYHHTGYVGELKKFNAAKMEIRHPGEILRLAVKGMLPAGPLGRAQLSKLKIYQGAEHPHEAQKPEVLAIDSMLVKPV